MGSAATASVPEPSSLPRVRVLCLPDVDRAIGGVKQLHRHVEHLTALGWDAAMLTEAPARIVPAFLNDATLPRKTSTAK